MHVGTSGGAAAANRARELGGYSCIMLAIAAGFEGQPRSEATPARPSWPADVQHPTFEILWHSGCLVPAIPTEVPLGQLNVA